MNSGFYPEKITPFLKEKMSLIKKSYGEDSKEYQALSIQYLKSEKELENTREKNLKHYEAQINIIYKGVRLRGLERLYEKSVVIEPTFVCLAHCRYCLRSNYERYTLTEKELIDIARYCGDGDNANTLEEVLITGGDPLLIPRRLSILLDALIEYAPNIKVFRIATRIPGQDPERIDDVIALLSRYKYMRIEIATQINHPIEFFEETEAAFKKISELGIKIYSQNVLLRGVNDDEETLINLYNKMRDNGIEAHYLFHCVPIRGMHHLRTSIDRTITLANYLHTCGKISGRAKPVVAVMTDIGKISLFEGSIIKRDGDKILFQSNYRFDDRIKWNPAWKLPLSAEIDKDGFLRVWYVDCLDEKSASNMRAKALFGD